MLDRFQRRIARLHGQQAVQAVAAHVLAQEVGKEIVVEGPEQVLLGRQVDYRFQVLNRQGRAPFIISCAGHEAAQIGVGWPLKPKYDWISPYYRDVVLNMRMGMSPLDLMLSVLAKAADPASGGKQTPGHFSDTRLNIISGGSPVATQMVHGAGVAYALKMDGTDTPGIPPTRRSEEPSRFTARISNVVANPPGARKRTPESSSDQKGA